MGLNIGDWLTFDFHDSRCTHAQIIRYPILYRMSKRRSCSELDTADGGYDVIQTYVAGMKFETYVTHKGYPGHYSLHFFGVRSDIWG